MGNRVSLSAGGHRPPLQPHAANGGELQTRASFAIPREFSTRARQARNDGLLIGNFKGTLKRTMAARTSYPLIPPAWYTSLELCLYFSDSQKHVTTDCT